MSSTNILQSLTQYFTVNCIIFFVTLFLSIPLGLVITFGSMSKVKIIKNVTRNFVWIIRGSPLMLQLFIVLYLPGLLGYPMQSRMTAALVAFVINYAAYFSEIYRGGIESIPIGQYEAGQVLGLDKKQVFYNIILFQLIKKIVPAMGNEVITLVKDTSLARVIGVAELIMAAERFSSRGIIWPLFFSGIYFLVATGVVTLILNYIEKKLNYYKG